MRFIFLFLAFYVWLPQPVCNATKDSLDPVAVANTHIASRETHGPNRSPVIDRWNRAVSIPLGSPYCASACSAWLTESGCEHTRIRSGWSRAFVQDPRAVSASKVLRGEVNVEKGDIIVWKRKGGGHIGIAAEDWEGSEGATIEANTSPPKGKGSQWDGDGVWRRWRKITPFGSYRITHVLKMDKHGHK